jgi:hypothetical protein
MEPSRRMSWYQERRRWRLVILTPFPKDKICCRQSEDVRTEFPRLKYLELQTIVQHGTSEEAEEAKQDLKKRYGTSAPGAAMPDVESADAGVRVDRLQRHHASITAPGSIDRTEPIPGLAESGTTEHPFQPPPIRSSLRKRKLDTTPTIADTGS